jgi:hypothetical protein
MICIVGYLLVPGFPGQLAFGDQYRAYMQRVAAFLPRLGTRPSARTS